MIAILILKQVQPLTLSCFLHQQMHSIKVIMKLFIVSLVALSTFSIVNCCRSQASDYLSSSKTGEEAATCLLLSHRGSQPAAAMACCLLRWMTTDMRVPKNNIRKQVFEQILQVLQEFKRGVLPVLAFWIASLAALFLRFLRVLAGVGCSQIGCEPRWFEKLL